MNLARFSFFFSMGITSRAFYHDLCPQTLAFKKFLRQGLGKLLKEGDLVVYTSNPSLWQSEAGGSL